MNHQIRQTADGEWIARHADSHLWCSPRETGQDAAAAAGIPDGELIDLDDAVDLDTPGDGEQTDDYDDYDGG